MDTGDQVITPQPPPGRATFAPATAADAMPRAAGFWLRFWAWLFDTAILSLVVALLSYLVKLAFGVALVAFVVGLVQRGMNGSAGGAVAMFAFLLTWLLVVVVSWLVGQLVGWAYYAFFEASTAQATPGKSLLALRVVDADNRRISFGRATLRHVFKFAWVFPAIIAVLAVPLRGRLAPDASGGAGLVVLSVAIAPVLFVLFYGMAGWTSRKRALHDLLSGCFVIRSRELAPGGVFALALASVAAALAVHIFLSSAGTYRTTGGDDAPPTTRVQVPLIELVAASLPVAPRDSVERFPSS